VEEAFCELKSYLEVRPVHHRRPDRVVNHVRLCFLAYWLSARLGGEWRAKGETEEVPRILRHLRPSGWAPCGWANALSTR
jgi:transposase